HDGGPDADVPDAPGERLEDDRDGRSEPDGPGAGRGERTGRRPVAASWHQGDRPRAAGSGGHRSAPARAEHRERLRTHGRRPNERLTAAKWALRAFAAGRSVSEMFRFPVGLRAAAA